MILKDFIKMFSIYFLLLLLLNLFGEAIIYVANTNPIKPTVGEYFIHSFILGILLTFVSAKVRKRVGDINFYIIPSIYLLVTSLLLLFGDDAQKELVAEALITLTLISSSFLIVVYEMINNLINDESNKFLLYFFLTAGLSLFYYSINKLGYFLFLQLKDND